MSSICTITCDPGRPSSSWGPAALRTFEDCHDFERKIDNPTDRDVEAVQASLEELGAVFIPENGGGIGVRLKFSTAEARQIARLEGEGGITANDRVP